MANPEYLKVLKQGVEVWNQWREDNPEVVPDLQGADLQGMNLQWVDFRKAKLRNVEFHGIMPVADLRESDLFETDFSGALLYNTNLKGAFLVGTDLRGADIQFATITQATVLGVKYDNKMKCLGCNTEGSTGSQRFFKHIKDMDYIEETREKYPWKYWLWKWTSDCGRSISQWTLISIVTALLFGVIFANYSVWGWLPDWLQSLLTTVAPKMNYSNPSIADGWFTPYYFSLVTFTTLGFGDVTPTNTVGQIWLALEMVLGYIMLGGLITLFATKMVRQSG